MFNKSGKEEFRQNLEFSYQRALASFLKDNALLFGLLLAVSAASAVIGGVKGILTNRRILNALLVLIICRAFFNGLSRSPLTITLEKDHDSTKDSE